jgi:hypothetical protein
MALPTSGPLTLEQIAAEFGRGNPVSLLSYYRGGGIVPNASVNQNVPTSGPISIKNFYGATNRVSISTVISSNATNYVLTPPGGYVPGITDWTVTVNGGVTLNASGSNALSLNGGLTTGDRLIFTNNGTIVGQGGVAGNGPGGGGGDGGTALYFNMTNANVTFLNNGNIIGGGGGGGGGGGQGHNFTAGSGGNGGAGIVFANLASGNSLVNNSNLNGGGGGGAAGQGGGGGSGGGGGGGAGYGAGGIGGLNTIHADNGQPGGLLNGGASGASTGGSPSGNGGNAGQGGQGGTGSGGSGGAPGSALIGYIG